MVELVCEKCRTPNDFDAEFCSFCHAFLAWDDAERADGRSGGAGTRTSPVDEHAIETRVIPRVRVVPNAAISQQGATHAIPAVGMDATEGLLQVRTEQVAVVLPATGEPATLVLRITNTSIIVDGYAVTTIDAPNWLTVESDQLQLLPNTEKSLQVRLRIDSQKLVPAQVLQARLRVTSMTQPPAHADLSVEVTVPVVDMPVTLLAEPWLLRLRDESTAQFTVFADNTQSNRGTVLTFRGSDPELAVRFRFQPPALELGPGASGRVQVIAMAATPEPGAELARTLTIYGVDAGRRSVETVVTLQQLSSAPVDRLS